jgi:hypothetical protein
LNAAINLSRLGEALPWKACGRGAADGLGWSRK